MKAVCSGQCELLDATFFLTDKVLSLSFNSCTNPRPLIIMEKRRGVIFRLLLLFFMSFYHGLLDRFLFFDLPLEVNSSLLLRWQGLGYVTHFAWKGDTDNLVVSALCSLLDNFTDYNRRYFMWFAHMSQLFCFGTRFFCSLISQPILFQLKSTSKEQADWILISCLTLLLVFRWRH